MRRGQAAVRQSAACSRRRLPAGDRRTRARPVPPGDTFAHQTRVTLHTVVHAAMSPGLVSGDADTDSGVRMTTHAVDVTPDGLQVRRARTFSQSHRLGQRASRAARGVRSKPLCSPCSRGTVWRSNRDTLDTPVAGHARLRSADEERAATLRRESELPHRAVSCCAVLHLAVPRRNVLRAAHCGLPCLRAPEPTGTLACGRRRALPCHRASTRPCWGSSVCAHVCAPAMMGGVEGRNQHTFQPFLHVRWPRRA